MLKHPPDRRYPPGLEWTLFKKLPLLTVLGFVLIGLVYGLIRIWPWAGDAQQAAEIIQRGDFALIGASIFHLTVILTLAIGCVVVLIMKGPRYSADAYPVSDAEKPSK